ncbi:MAG: S49 family peptidase [Bacteroidota bacterium]
MESLSEALSARWLIHRSEVLNYLPILLSFLNGNTINASAIIGDPGKTMVYSKSATGSFVITSEISNMEIPENSIAVIPIQGVMLSSRTQQLMDNIAAAEANPAFSSILFFVNTPGGMVFLTDVAAAAIKNCKLPTVAFIQNMAASAGMWLTSAMTTRIASSRIDLIGSIGVKTSFMDLNGFLKDKLNITVYDLYATKATRKDEEVRALLSDPSDSKPFTDYLDHVNEIFHTAIQTNLGIDPKSEVFSGAIYNADQAKSFGLIDSIGTLETAIETAYQLGIKSQINSISSHLNSKHK